MTRMQGSLERAAQVLAGEQDYLEPGKGIVTIGRPSGAPPVFLEPIAPDELAPRGELAPLGPRDPLDLPRDELEDWEMRVRPGDVLSRIVKVQYGRVSRDLEQKVARYNNLRDPDKLIVGQVLYLPTLERLLEQTR